MEKVIIDSGGGKGYYVPSSVLEAGKVSFHAAKMFSTVEGNDIVTTSK